MKKGNYVVIEFDWRGNLVTENDSLQQAIKYAEDNYHPGYSTYVIAKIVKAKGKHG